MAREHRATAPAALAAATVLAQVTYPLLDGEALRRATMAVVLLFCAASLAHAGTYLGVGAAARLLAVAGGLGLAAEALGVHTGFPFGEYAYAGTLGPEIAGVPVLIALAWTMMAYPCLLLGRRLAGSASRRTVVGSQGRGGRRGARVALIGGTALASWDLFLDPQMVGAGHWAFANPEPALPGIPGIPVTNYLGWLLVAVVMIAALDATLPGHDLRGLGTNGSAAAIAVPAGLLVWTWLGSTLANIAFFDRPAVALWGGLLMGVSVGPYVWSLSASSATVPAATTPALPLTTTSQRGAE